MTSDGRSIYEEGLYIPLMRFARAGNMDQSLIDIITANVREPVQVIGDLHSLATCNEIACNRLREMLDEFSLNALEGLAKHILNTSRAATVINDACLMGALNWHLLQIFVAAVVFDMEQPGLPALRVRKHIIRHSSMISVAVGQWSGHASSCSCPAASPIENSP